MGTSQRLQLAFTCVHEPPSPQPNCYYDE